MFQTDFSREGMNSYMIVSFEGELSAGYQSSLFQHHSVPYFLQYEVREVDGKQAVYYQLKYHTTIKSVIRHLPFTLERLKNMVDSIIGAMEAADEYLLDPDGIVWETDKIFLDAETGKLQFCYYAMKGEGRSSVKDFLSEVIQAADKRDERAVLFLLQFYDLVTEQDCTLKSLQRFRKEYIEGELRIQNKKEEGRDKESFQDASLQRNGLRKELGKKGKKPLIGESLVRTILAVDAAISLVLIAGLLFRIFTYNHLHLLFISMGVLIVLTVVYMQMTKENSADSIIEDFFENQTIYSEQNCENQNEEIQVSMSYGKETNNNFVVGPSETEVYGETSILTDDKLKENQNEIVLEEKEGVLYLKPIEKDKYPSIHIDNSIVLGCMTGCCNYVLSEKGVSRMHAKLMKKPDGIYLLDLNSTNGTYLNGELIQSGKDYKLEEGDMVVFAMIEFFVTVEQ